MLDISGSIFQQRRQTNERRMDAPLFLEHLQKKYPEMLEITANDYESNKLYLSHFRNSDLEYPQDFTWYFPSIFRKIRLHQNDYYEEYMINQHDQLYYWDEDADVYLVGMVVSGCSHVHGATHYVRVIQNMGTFPSYQRGPCNDCWGTGPTCGSTKFVPVLPGQKTIVFLPGTNSGGEEDQLISLYAPDWVSQCSWS